MPLIIFILATISALFAVVLLCIWKWIEPSRHVLLWAAAYAAVCVQWVFVAAGLGAAGRTAEFGLLASAAALVAAQCVFFGYRARAGRPMQVVPLVAVALCAMAAVLWFSAVRPAPEIAATVLRVHAFGLLLACIPSVATARPVPVGERAMMLVLGLFASLQLASGVAALVGANPDALTAPLFHYLLLPAFYAGTGAFMLFLVATDLSERVRALATVDPLTGILNHRGFQQAAHRALVMARRTAQPLALVTTDLDHFRRINDSYGHAAGDAALQRFAAHLQSELRESDIVGRMGGQEFALLLTNTDLADALRVAERLRSAMELASAEVGPARIALTASFGLAELSFEDADVEDLLERADRGLYLAKETGRNRVCVAPDGDSSSASDFAVA